MIKKSLRTRCGMRELWTMKGSASSADLNENKKLQRIVLTLRVLRMLRVGVGLGYRRKSCLRFCGWRDTLMGKAMIASDLVTGKRSQTQKLCSL